MMQCRRDWREQTGVDDMDQCQFEGLTRQLGTASTRRDALQILLGVVVAAIPVLGTRAQDALASKLTKGCRNVGQRCGRDEDCCGGSHCANKRCKCIQKGKSCLILLDEETGFSIPQKALCCSAKCSKGPHTCK